VGFAARDEACAMRGFIVVSPVQRPIAFDGGDVGCFRVKSSRALRLQQNGDVAD
jgi:hypothetical protein